MNSTSLAAVLAVPSALTVDVSAGFLDRVAEADTAAPAARNLRKLIPGHPHLQTVESRQAPAYRAKLARVLAALDFGSRYAGYTPDQAAAMDSVTERFGGDHLADPDVVAVAGEYHLPRLLIAGHGPLSQRYSDPAHPEHMRLRALFASDGIPFNSSVTLRAYLISAAEVHLERLEREAVLEGRRARGTITERAWWYHDVPDGTCPDNSGKRKQHAEAARRIMSEQIAIAEALDANRYYVRDLYGATSTLTVFISHGRVPDDEIAPLVADVVTRAEAERARYVQAALPAPRRAAEAEAGPAGAIGSAVIADEQAAAEELERARKVAVGAIRRKLERSPEASDRELWLAVAGKYRTPLASVRAEVIAEARTGEAYYLSSGTDAKLTPKTDS